MHLKSFHTLNWCLWLVAAFLPAVLTNNPVYLVLLLLVVGFTYYYLGKANPMQKSWLAFMQLGLVMALFSIAFNLLGSSVGETVLISLPRKLITAPGQPNTILWQVGGPITLEMLSTSIASSLGLLTMLVVFATFNTLVDHYQLVRYIPRFMTQTAIIVSIALTFIPQMMIAQQEIREAQLLRGHQFNRLKDLLPLFVIILNEGLERALTLAESMEARGFGGQLSNTHRETWLKLAFAAELLAMIAGTGWMILSPSQWLGQLLIGVSGAAILLTLWLTGKGVQRSRYRREVWRRHDTILAIAGSVVIMVWLITYIFFKINLVFYPYPRFSMPVVNPFLVASLFLLAIPLLFSKPEGDV